MSEPKWTPGPWHVVGENEVAAQDGGVAEIVTWYRKHEEIVANAHLISAAPDLYEACQAALVAIETNPIDHFLTPEEEVALDKLRAVLRKVRGETTGD